MLSQKAGHLDIVSVISQRSWCQTKQRGLHKKVFSLNGANTGVTRRNGQPPKGQLANKSTYTLGNLTVNST